MSGQDKQEQWTKRGRPITQPSNKRDAPRMRARNISAKLSRTALALLLALAAASCHHPPPPANPHYVLGAPYQADGVWYYPRESYQQQETGVAMVYPSGHADLTADGEAFDQTALAAAHQTLQLPVVGRLTNLENGRQVLVRINDRGPATPHRLIEVTRRTATLLDFPADGVARVRLEVVPTESYAAVDAVQGAPKLEVSTAPLGAVQQSELPRPVLPRQRILPRRPRQRSRRHKRSQRRTCTCRRR